MFLLSMYRTINNGCLVIVLLLMTTVVIYAQGLGTSNTQRIVAQIDSIKKHSNIELASVCFKEVDNFQNNTSTYTECPVKSQKFSMHNGFLEIGKAFYNLDKLLYFEIEDDNRRKSLIFYFQYY